MLLDVGTWLAAVWGGHVWHERVSAWLEAQESELWLCRVTQMGILRLLSNPSVLGDKVLSRADAWQALDEVRTDERVRWVGEPAELEHAWRAISARDDNSHKLWTDDYLAAFVQVTGTSLVTLDKGFERRYPSIAVITLT